MTDAEKAALEFLDREIDCHPGWVNVGHCRTLKAMLAEPRLPKDLDDDVKAAMRQAFDLSYCHTDFIIAMHRALYAHLTRKPPKTVWRVQPEGWPFEDFEAINVATARAGHWLAQDIEVSIRKTEVRT